MKMDCLHPDYYNLGGMFSFVPLLVEMLFLTLNKSHSLLYFCAFLHGFHLAKKLLVLL